MSLLFIVNPVSRGGKNREYINEIQEWIDQRSVKAEVWVTKGPAHAIELAQAAVERKVKLLVSVGGDGTLNEVVNGVMMSPEVKRPPIGIIGRGTGGDFVRRLKELYPIPDSLDWLLDTQTISVDVGSVNLSQSDGKEMLRYFVNIADVGLAGEVTRRVNASRKRLGSLEYLRSTLLAAFQYRSPRVRLSGIEVEGQEIPNEVELLILVLANGRYFGGGMCIAPDADWDDGYVQVLLCPKISYFSLLAQLPNLYRKRRMKHKRLFYGRGKKITLFSRDALLPLDIDGEYFEAQQVEFKLLPKALSLVVPKALR